MPASDPHLPNIDLSALVPEVYAAFRPLLTDAFRYFVDRLPLHRRLELAAHQAALPSQSPAGGRLVVLARDCPTLHKLGQVLARNRHLDPDLRLRLQALESAPARAAMEDIAPDLHRELAASEGAYDVAIDAAPLAEASVAVVVGCRWRPRGESRSGEGVLKILRPGTRERLAEELAIFEDLAGFLDERRERYGLPDFPFRDTFSDVRNLLEAELDLSAEQAHLRSAAARYRGCDDVLIPAVLPFSTPRLTAMERIQGRRVTEVMREGATAGRRLARAVADALLLHVAFSDDAVVDFHADPHAGNLFAAEDGRLAILDWALVGRMPKSTLEAMVDLVLAAIRFDSIAVRCAVEALSAGGGGGAGATEGPAAVNLRAEEAIERSLRRLRGGALPGPAWLANLLDELARGGVRFPASMMLFRKVLLVVGDVVRELDAALSLDALFVGRLIGCLFSEWPRRALAPARSRDFPSHLSNADLLSAWASLPLSAAAGWASGWRDWFSRRG